MTSVKGMRMASRTALWAGTRRMHGLESGKLERFLVHDSNEIRVCISRRRPANLCKTCDIGQILDLHCDVGRYQERRGTQSSLTCGVLGDLNTVVFKNPQFGTSAVKTDVNQSDIGSKTLGLQRFCRMRVMLGLSNEFGDTWSPGIGVTHHWLKWTHVE